MIPYSLRAAQENDAGFIFSSWLAAYHECQPINFCPNDIYLPNQRQIITFLLTHAQTIIICHPDDPNELLGFICYQFVSQQLVVHWMYIKFFRLQGLATQVLTQIYPETKAKPIIVTHNSKLFNKLRPIFKLIYDPYLIPNMLKDFHG